jgi:hypothetical protein
MKKIKAKVKTKTEEEEEEAKGVFTQNWESSIFRDTMQIQKTVIALAIFITEIELFYYLWIMTT